LLPRTPGKLQPRPRDLHVGQVAEELGVLGELHARGQITPGLVEAAPVEQVPGQADVRTAGVLNLARLQGNPVPLSYSRLASRTAEMPAGDTDVCQRV